MEECRDCYYLTKCIEQEHGKIEKDWRESLEDEQIEKIKNRIF